MSYYWVKCDGTYSTIQAARRRVICEECGGWHRAIGTAELCLFRYLRKSREDYAYALRQAREARAKRLKASRK